MEHEQTKHSLTANKTLIILASLLLCALVYIFIELRTGAEPSSVEVYTPRPTVETAPTPESTPEPGLHKSVMIERIYDDGLYIVGTKDENYYRVSASEEDIVFALSLYATDGYVHGFTLEIEGPAPPDVSKNPGAIETALMQDYYEYLLYEDLLIRHMLPKLLNAFSPDGVFPPNTSLAWVEMAVEARTSGETLTDSGNGYSLTCTCTRLNILTIAVGKE